jgi:hypothetical protein
MGNNKKAKIIIEFESGEKLTYPIANNVSITMHTECKLQKGASIPQLYPLVIECDIEYT